MAGYNLYEILIPLISHVSNLEHRRDAQIKQISIKATSLPDQLLEMVLCRNKFIYKSIIKS